MTDLKPGMLQPGMLIKVTTRFTAMPLPDTSGRPDNSNQSNPSLWCRDISTSGYQCQATRGHYGDHMPYNSARDDRLAADPWPNLDDGGVRPDNSYQPTASLQCRARNDGLYCLATRGHSGDHMPYYSMGAGHNTPWPNTADMLYTSPVDRPRFVPPDADWPPYPGRIIMFKVGAHGEAICSDCIKDDTVADTMIRGRSVVQAGRTRNHDWHCWARPIHSSRTCYNYGTRLPR